MEAYVIASHRDHYSEDGKWHHVEHLPTFYLLRCVQAIRDEDHAASIAAFMLNVPHDNVSAYHTVLP